ncbi:MAG: dihydrodipicolinate synthase family protein [Anaerolineae bacterium]|nr:dihydrodipicolinate synthase family protein [Anaerolineae bacterium]
MDVTTRLRGIVTVLNTPFTEDDEVDLDALGAHVEHAIQCGVAGFLVPALASEVYKLSANERMRMVRATLDAAGGRVPVIGGATAGSPDERLAAARELVALGCDAILAAIPYTDAADYTRQVEALARLEPPLLMLQDWDAAGAGLPLALIGDLFERFEAFRSIKIEVVPAGVKYTQALEATGGRLHVAGGWAVTQMIEALDRGVHALMPTGLHPVYVRIFRLYQQGDREGAAALFRRLVPVLAFSNQHLDISIHFFKRLLHRQGIYPTARVRQPITPFDSYHARIADELIDYALDLMREVQAG